MKREAQLESYRQDAGEPDEEHGGVAFWDENPRFNFEFPTPEGLMGVFVDMESNYVEIIGPSGKVVNTLPKGPDSTSLVRLSDVSRELEKYSLAPEIMEKISLILIRIGHEMGPQPYS